jgi:hypothetical protein
MTFVIEAKAAQVNGKGFRCDLLALRRPLSGIRSPAEDPFGRQGRLGGLAAQFTAGGAVHPMRAMLNFAAAIVNARLTQAIIAMGLDPCFGSSMTGGSLED